MEQPLVLVPLIGETYQDLFNSTTTRSGPLNVSLAVDTYGYPLMRNRFPSATLNIAFPTPHDITSQFSFSIQVKPLQMTPSMLVQLEISELMHIVFSMEADGNLSTRYLVIFLFVF